jgi:hypothetical protein
MQRYNDICADAKDKVQKDRLAVLAIAYHNIGVEQEFLKKYLESIRSYQKGVSELFATEYHPTALPKLSLSCISHLTRASAVAG